MSNLGSLVVRLVAEGIAKYKADLNGAANDTANAAAKIEQSTGHAGAATGKMGEKLAAARQVAGAASGDLMGAAQGAQTLAAGAGVATLGVGLLAAGLAAVAYAAHVGAQEQKAYDKALILSGNAAGTNASQLQAMASSIDKVVGTHYEAAAALTQMAATGQVAGDNLQKFSETAIEMERTVGQSVGDTVKQFSELGQAPVQASLKLNEATNYLTASTFAQIKAAEDLGDKERAASLAQNAYADAMKTRTAQIEGNLGTLERAWRGVRDFAKEAWDAMLGLGRKAGPEQALEAAKGTVANLETLLARGGTATPDIQRKLDAAKQNLSLMQETVRFSDRAAQSQADGVASEKAKIAWLQAGEKYQSKREKSEEAIKRIRFEGAAAGATELEIEKRIAVERAKGADSPGRAGKADNSAQRLIDSGTALSASLLAQDSGLSGDFIKKWEALNAAYAAGAVSVDTLVQSQAVLLGQQPAMRDAARELAQAQAEAEKEQDKATKARLATSAKAERQKDHATKRNAADVGHIATSLMNPEQQENEVYGKRLSALVTFRDAQLENESEGNRLLEEEKQRHEDTMASIKFQSDQMVLTSASQATDQMYGLLKQAGLEQTALGKVAFIASKALAVAQIILSTNVAAAAALALPPLGLGPVAGLPLSGFITAMGYASAGVTAGLAIAQVSAEGGYDIPEGVNPVVQTHAKEMILPRAESNWIRRAAQNDDDGGKGHSGGAITIINQTSSKIGKVTERGLSNGDRALIIEEAVAATAAHLGDPNSKTSRAMSRNFSVQRSR
jgi:phage-related minor tail protein